MLIKMFCHCDVTKQKRCDLLLSPCLAEGFGFLLGFELTDEVSTAGVGRFRNRSIQA